MIVYLRTDKPDAEIWLSEHIDSNEASVLYTWSAHRELSDTIHRKLISLLHEKGKKIPDIGGIVFYTGPGSFTGLRIGASVAQSLAWSLGVPLVGVNGNDWLALGRQALQGGERTISLRLEYGGKIHITEQKK